MDIQRFKRLAGIITEEKDSFREQKDWIVYDFNKNNLFCITIADDGNEWKLIEFVNFFEISDKKFQEVVSMGYYTMIDAALTIPSYKYIIAQHQFSKNDIDVDYWRNLIPNDKFWKKASLKVTIDKKEFEKEINKLSMKKLYSN